MYEQTHKIRELINKPIIRCILLQSGVLWDQLSSCLDVIGDTELAITAYLRREFGESTEVRYLAVYGLLQALFAQQDAVKFLCTSLGMPEKDPLKKYPRLIEIREIRNDTIGHPTMRDRQRKREKPPSYHFISRPTLTHDGFQHVSFDSNGKLDFEDVSIPDLIEDQRTCLSEILTSVIGELEQKGKAHKEKFKMEKLVTFFPATLDYDFEKVTEGTRAIENDPRGKISLSTIKKAFQDFREALAKRGVTYDSINYVYELLDYPLTELEAFFQNLQNGKELNINEKTAFIFAFFVEKHVEELKLLAQEIDDEYSS